MHTNRLSVYNLNIIEQTVLKGNFSYSQCFGSSGEETILHVILKNYEYFKNPGAMFYMVLKKYGKKWELVNFQDLDGNTPIILAVMRGLTKCAEMLYMNCPIDINICNYQKTMVKVDGENNSRVCGSVRKRLMVTDDDEQVISNYTLDSEEYLNTEETDPEYIADDSFGSDAYNMKNKILTRLNRLQTKFDNPNYDEVDFILNEFNNFIDNNYKDYYDFSEIPIYKTQSNQFNKIGSTILEKLDIILSKLKYLRGGADKKSKEKSFESVRLRKIGTFSKKIIMQFILLALNKDPSNKEKDAMTSAVTFVYINENGRKEKGKAIIALLNLLSFYKDGKKETVVSHIKEFIEQNKTKINSKKESIQSAPKRELPKELKPKSTKAFKFNKRT